MNRYEVTCLCADCIRMNLAIGIAERVADLQSEYATYFDAQGLPRPMIRIEWPEDDHQGGER